MSLQKRLYIQVIAAAFILLPGCNTKSKTEGNSIRYYYRNIGGNNGYVTYRDYLVITNYRDKSTTFKQFADIARHYIDTVKSDLPVSGVTFVGEDRETKLPKGDWDHFSEQKKYFIVSVGFDNSFEKNATKPHKNVNFAKIWGDVDKMYMSKEEVDPLLSSKEKLATGF